MRQLPNAQKPSVKHLTSGNMTTEQKRIKIAEACGWLDITRCTRRLKPAEDGVCVMGTKDPPSINYAREYSFLPDYFNDLNACHQMEKMLTHENWQTYSERLRTEVGFGCEDYRDANGTVVIELCGPQWHATAAQRAEAFGKTLNLW